MERKNHENQALPHGLGNPFVVLIRFLHLIEIHINYSYYPENLLQQIPICVIKTIDRWG